jgi:hypothetical protein
VVTFDTNRIQDVVRALTIPTVVFMVRLRVNCSDTQCKEAAAHIKGAQLVMVPQAPHKIDDPNYQSAIQAAFA